MTDSAKTKEKAPEVKKVYGSFLKDLIVDIKPIESNGKWTGLLVKGQEMKKDPFIFNKVKRSYQVPLNKATAGGGIKIILDNNKRVLIKKYEEKYPHGMTEQEFFENELGVDLNPFLDKDDPANFWRKSKKGRVMLTKEGITLNLNRAMDMMRYKILLSNTKKVAPSYEVRKQRTSYEFMIVNKGQMVSKRVEEANVKAQAFVEYAKVTSSKDNMINFIKSLGRTIPVAHTEDWLKAEILTVMEGSPKDFIAKVSDPTYEARIFVQNACEVGAIKRMNEKRYVLDSGAELGDLLDVINYLSDPDNQEVKYRIQAKIEMAQKK